MPYDWATLMTRWNAELLASGYGDDGARAAGYLGFEGATEQEIAELERRIGLRLPASYREFLAYTDGWGTIGPFISRVWGTGEVGGFAARHPDWVRAYTIGAGVRLTDAEYLVYGSAQDPARFRQEYLNTAIEVSDVGDDAILLLNPETRTSDGEWEAWFFANWNPGADRYRSFWDLMQSQYASFKEIDD
jgi:hypothetical protein